MFAIVKNNQILKTAGSIKSLFPNTSFSVSGPSAEWKAENGVMEVAEGEQKDQRFYWVSPTNPTIQIVDGIPTRTYVNIPKQLEDNEENFDEFTPNEISSNKGLKSKHIEQIKESGNKELASTDWYIIRKIERNIEIPEEIVNARTQIIANINSKEIKIRNATNIEELIEAIK